jgi:hypothetical protein
MRRDSIQRRLIASVLLSQIILTVGLVVIGVVVTYWRLLSTLDTSMQAHATSVAVLVRYTEDASGHVYFDNCCPSRLILIIRTSSWSGPTAPGF